jgi:hypothetical protein
MIAVFIHVMPDCPIGEMDRDRVARYFPSPITIP